MKTPLLAAVFLVNIICAKREEVSEENSARPTCCRRTFQVRCLDESGDCEEYLWKTCEKVKYEQRWTKYCWNFKAPDKKVISCF